MLQNFQLNAYFNFYYYNKIQFYFEIKLIRYFQNNELINFKN